MTPRHQLLLDIHVFLPQSAYLPETPVRTWPPWMHVKKVVRALERSALPLDWSPAVTILWALDIWALGISWITLINHTLNHAKEPLHNMCECACDCTCVWKGTVRCLRECRNLSDFALLHYCFLYLRFPWFILSIYCFSLSEKKGNYHFLKGIQHGDPAKNSK